MLKQGGWPMIPLGLCSLAAVTIVIERFVALRHETVFDKRILALLANYTGEEHAEQAVVICQRVKTPLARIIEEILKARHLDHAETLATMHATGRTQVSTLERGLTLLEIIAGITPLIGLLGTVLGMVTVFNAISTEGIGNPQVLSEGISKALITTVGGLCVAIPALGFHSWLSRRVDEFATEMQDLATMFIARLHGLPRP